LTWKKNTSYLLVVLFFDQIFSTKISINLPPHRKTKTKTAAASDTGAAPAVNCK